MRILIALTGLLLGFAGCSDTSPEAQIRSLIPEASSISNADFNTVAFSGQTPSRNQVKNRSLSWLLMVLRVSAIEASPAHSNDFRYFGDIYPAKLGEAMWKSKGKGYATMIQPEFIESVDCKIVGENAVGTVSFTAVGLYAGKVEFTAARRSNRWQIEQFRLPGYRLKTTRGSDGLWKEETWDSLESNIKDAQQDAEPDTAKPGECPVIVALSSAVRVSLNVRRIEESLYLQRYDATANNYVHSQTLGSPICYGDSSRWNCRRDLHMSLWPVSLLCGSSRIRWNVGMYSTNNPSLWFANRND